MSARRGTAGRRRTRARRPTARARRHSRALIPPLVHRIGAELEAGRVIPESVDLQQLADALRREPNLYWHPLVRRQLAYLTRLRRREEEWKRVGWGGDEDDEGRVKIPPQVVHVEAVLQMLMDAHVGAMLPRMEVTSRRIRKRPGRRGGLPNPHPTDANTEWIDGAMLQESWLELREQLESANPRIRRPPIKPTSDYLDKVAAQLTDAANASPALREWSTRIDWQVDEPPDGLTEGQRLSWQLDRLPTARTTVDLRAALASALNDPRQRTRLAKSGLAAYLASIVLAAHLDLEPDHIQNAMDHYNKTHGNTLPA